MAGNLKLKIGDMVVRCGRVFRVLKVNKETVFFKPCFGSNIRSGGFIYSVPIKNMELVKIRRVVSKDKLASLFRIIFRKVYKEEEEIVLDVKEALGSNDLGKIMRVVKKLKLEQQSGTESLSSGKSSDLKQALDQATEEVAAVRGVTLEKAKKKIFAVLEAGSG